ncbi:MAG: hypothetical protein U0V54_13520 [Saprospiraceae bacterium]
MKRLLFFTLICFLISCASNNNCDVIDIDERVDSLEHSFTSPVKHPFKMQGEIRWKFIDTVIINGVYFGPMDTAFTIPASDFYNQNNVINFKYQRYKASKVDIHYAYCFY